MLRKDFLVIVDRLLEEVFAYATEPERLPE